MSDESKGKSKSDSRINYRQARSMVEFDNDQTIDTYEAGGIGGLVSDMSCNSVPG